MITKPVNILNTVIPISRFNKGEANKIFDEVSTTGTKIVLKNNKPACVLISPQEYEQMLEQIENYYLLIEAQKRIETANKTITQEELLNDLGISQGDIDSAEVDID